LLKRPLSIIVMTLALGLAGGYAVAQSLDDTNDNVPQTIPYEGFLEQGSTPVEAPGGIAVDFALYDGPTAPTPLHTESHPSVVVSSGRFSVLLGEGGLPDSVFDAGDLWLEIDLGSGALSPRQRVQAVPFARKAGVATHAVSATSADAAVEEGKVGDVRYSLLDLADFQALHGTGWRRLDGGSITGTPLAGYIGTSLPDARGVFLRGMNHDRPTSEGDAAGNRAMGAYQGDTFAAHSHTSPYQYYNGNAGPRGASGNDAAGAAQQTSTTGDLETRPRNIAVHIYVKVE
jgi:hypothetical protein